MQDWSTLDDPLTLDDRQAVATQACSDLKFDFTTVTDAMDDHVAIRWSGWPERLFVISQAGKIVYSGQQGPFGYNPGPGYAGFNCMRAGISLRTFLAAWREKRSGT